MHGALHCERRITLLAAREAMLSIHGNEIGGGVTRTPPPMVSTESTVAKPKLQNSSRSFSSRSTRYSSRAAFFEVPLPGVSSSSTSSSRDG